jgi:hypothetical protein
LKDNKQIICQCGLILLTGDDIYNHLQHTGHQLKTTTYNVQDYHLIEQILMRLRVELYAATQMLQGEHLEQFKKLIAEIATICKLEISDTGTFIKLDE